jgi:hypothetical protein
MERADMDFFEGLFRSLEGEMNKNVTDTVAPGSLSTV